MIHREKTVFLKYANSVLSLFFIVRSNFKAFRRRENMAHMGDLVQSTETVFIRDWLKSVGDGEGAEQIADWSIFICP